MSIEKRLDEIEETWRWRLEPPKDTQAEIVLALVVVARAAVKESGDLAEVVAHDFYHFGLKHPAWWRAVKRVRSALSALEASHE